MPPAGATGTATGAPGEAGGDPTPAASSSPAEGTAGAGGGAGWPRAIVHVDLDAFYASVEQLRRPELRGRPVIVGGGAGGDGSARVARGVVSAASYEARPFGVRSAMPLATALRLCPQAVVLPVDFPAYREASRAVLSIARSLTPLVEPVALDEAYLDVTGSTALLGPPPALAHRLRERIAAGCGLSASVGVATTRSAAKVASEAGKPGGIVVVEPGREAEFLAPLPLRRLPGLGPAAEAALSGLGVARLGELAALPPEIVERRLGRRHGRELWELASGVDHRPVTVPGLPRSISREQTFSRDVTDVDVLRRRVRALSADVARRLRTASCTCRTVVLKVRDGDLSTTSRRRSLPGGCDGEQEIAAAAEELLQGMWAGRPVRLLGVAAAGLERTAQLDLFAAPGDRPELDSRLDRVLDDVRARFGERALQRGTGGDELEDRDYRGEDLR